MFTIDERGKYYTERIRKHPVEVRVMTSHGAIRGYVHLASGQRVKDLLNNGTEQFLALTDVTLAGESWGMSECGGQHATAKDIDFIALNKRYIISVIPVQPDLPTSDEE